MKLISEAVDVARVNAECEECGGIFKPTGQVLTSHPPQYRHKCSDCGQEVFFSENYPRIVYTTRTSMPLTTDMLGTSMFRGKL